MPVLLSPPRPTHCPTPMPCSLSTRVFLLMHSFMYNPGTQDTRPSPSPPEPLPPLQLAMTRSHHHHHQQQHYSQQQQRGGPQQQRHSDAHTGALLVGAAALGAAGTSTLPSSSHPSHPPTPKEEPHHSCQPKTHPLHPTHFTPNQNSQPLQPTATARGGDCAPPRPVLLLCRCRVVHPRQTPQPTLLPPLSLGHAPATTAPRVAAATPLRDLLRAFWPLYPAPPLPELRAVGVLAAFGEAGARAPLWIPQP